MIKLAARLDVLHNGRAEDRVGSACTAHGDPQLVSKTSGRVPQQGGNLDVVTQGLARLVLPLRNARLPRSQHLQEIEAAVNALLPVRGQQADQHARMPARNIRLVVTLKHTPTREAVELLNAAQQA